MIIKQIQEKDIPEIISLAVRSFHDDWYYCKLIPHSQNREEVLSLLFKKSITYCVNNGMAYGVTVNDHFIAFLLYLDYDRLYKADIQEVEHIFGNKINPDIHLQATECGSYLIYLLSLAVDADFRRNGVASELIRFVLEKYPSYYFMGDISNSDSLAIYKKNNFNIQVLSENYHLVKKEPAFNLFDAEIIEKIKLVLPSKNVLEYFLPDYNGPISQIKLKDYTIVNEPNMVFFIFDPLQECTGILIETDYENLLKYQRFVNLSDFQEEQIFVNDNFSFYLYHQTNKREYQTLYNPLLEKMLETRKQEWGIIPDIFISFPIEYTDITKIESFSTKKYDKTISTLMNLLDFRTHFESGIPKNSQSTFLDETGYKNRIKRFYLGKINVAIFEETTPQTYINGGNMIGQPASADWFVSIDTLSGCGVVTLVSLSSPFLISHFLDNVIRNQLLVDQENNWINFFEFINIYISLLKRGTPKAFVNIPCHRTKINDDILCSLLFLETCYGENEGMGRIIDPDIINTIKHPSGSGQYEYATVYTHSNTVLQISDKFRGNVCNRISFESITLFYIELILFEESAIVSTSEKIGAFLSTQKLPPPNKTLKQISTIFNDYSKTAEFWEIEVNYPSSKKSIQMIRDSFRIEKKLNFLKRNQEQLQLIFQSQRDLLDRTEASILNYIILILTMVQVASIIAPAIFEDMKPVTGGKLLSLAIITLIVYLYSVIKKISVENRISSKQNKNRV